MRFKKILIGSLGLLCLCFTSCINDDSDDKLITLIQNDSVYYFKLDDDNKITNGVIIDYNFISYFDSVYNSNDKYLGAYLTKYTYNDNNLKVNQLIDTTFVSIDYFNENIYINNYYDSSIDDEKLPLDNNIIISYDGKLNYTGDEININDEYNTEYNNYQFDDDNVKIKYQDGLADINFDFDNMTFNSLFTFDDKDEIINSKLEYDKDINEYYLSLNDDIYTIKLDDNNRIKSYNGSNFNTDIIYYDDNISSKIETTIYYKADGSNDLYERKYNTIINYDNNELNIIDNISNIKYKYNDYYIEIEESIFSNNYNKKIYFNEDNKFIKYEKNDLNNNDNLEINIEYNKKNINHINIIRLNNEKEELIYDNDSIIIIYYQVDSNNNFIEDKRIILNEDFKVIEVINYNSES